LVSRKHVAKISDRIKASDQPINFQTANGHTQATDHILLNCEELGETIEPFVLLATPAVLSIGRCFQLGYSFRWPAGKLPYFITPSSKKVVLVVEDCIPDRRCNKKAKEPTLHE
jgi:hypothetical protein